MAPGCGFESRRHALCENARSDSSEGRSTISCSRLCCAMRWISRGRLTIRAITTDVKFVRRIRGSSASGTRWERSSPSAVLATISTFTNRCGAMAGRCRNATASRLRNSILNWGDTMLVQWLGSNGSHQTGYVLLDEDGLAMCQCRMEIIRVNISPWALALNQHIRLGGSYLIVPHFQPPHAIRPVWVPCSKLSRWKTRDEWEAA